MADFQDGRVRDQASARAIMKKRDAQIIKSPNVVGVAMKPDENGHWGIYVFVNAMLTSHRWFERVELEGMTIKVIETGEFQALQYRTQEHRPAPGGISIGHYLITAGTLGGIVYIGGLRYILSNNHVLANKNFASIGDPIYQPGPYDGGGPLNQIGTLYSFEVIVYNDQLNPNYVDAALCEFDDQADADNYIYEFGYYSGATAAYVGQDLTKSGRTTGVTLGYVDYFSGLISISYGPGLTGYFDDQIVVHGDGMDWGNPGDSGSLAIDVATNGIVGLHFAGAAFLGVVNRAPMVQAALGFAWDVGSSSSSSWSSSSFSSSSGSSTSSSFSSSSASSGSSSFSSSSTSSESSSFSSSSASSGSSSYSSSSYSSTSVSFSSSSSSFSSSSYSSTSVSFSSSSSSFSSSSFSSTSVSFSSSSSSFSSSSYSSTSVSSSFSSSSFSSQSLPGAVLFITEEDNFQHSTVVGHYYGDIKDIALVRHERTSRLIVGWIDDEVAKWAYSDNVGATWSPTFILGSPYTSLDFVDLPTGHVMVILEHHHRLWGRISRDHGVSWDPTHRIYVPEAALDPALLIDAYKDAIVFAAELNVDIPLDHKYKIVLQDLPFYAFMSAPIDWGDVQFISSSSSSSSSFSSSSSSSFSCSSCSSSLSCSSCSSGSISSSFSSSCSSSFSSSCSSSFSSSSSSYSSSSFSSSSSSSSFSSSSFSSGSLSSFSSSSESSPSSFSSSSSSYSSSSWSSVSVSFSSSSSSFSSSSFSSCSSSFSSSSFSSCSSSFSSSSSSFSSSSFSSCSSSFSSSSFSSCSSSFSSSSSSFSSSSFSSCSSSFSSSSSSSCSSSFSSSSSISTSSSFSSSSSISTSSSFSSSSESSCSSSFSSSSSISTSSSFSSSSLSSSFSSSVSSSFSSSSSSFSSSSLSSSLSSSVSSSFSSSSQSSSVSSSQSISSSSSSWTEPACAESVTELDGENVDGDIYDGSGSWDGLGNGVNSSAQFIRVGDIYSSGSSKNRYRGFLKFDLDPLLGIVGQGATIYWAYLWAYYRTSYGDGVLDAAPDSNDVGHVIVDHIEDFGSLNTSDYQMAAKASDIGTLVPNDNAPSFWAVLDVTSYVQIDIDELDTPNTSCFRLRQSYEESYASCTSSNYWSFDSANRAGTEPYLIVCYKPSSSSSSSSESSSQSSSSSSSQSSSSFSSSSQSSQSSSSFSSSSQSSSSFSSSFSSSSQSSSFSSSSSSSSQSSSTSSSSSESSQ